MGRIEPISLQLNLCQSLWLWSCTSSTIPSSTWRWSVGGFIVTTSSYGHAHAHALPPLPPPPPPPPPVGRI
eukprot:9331882-Pyramimonas_sp.AAC.1